MKKVLLVPGDGIGPEVMHEARKLLAKIQKKFALNLLLDKADFSAERFLKDGFCIKKEDIKKLPEKYDAILFGALGDPRIKDMAHGREILLGLRFGLDLFINLRPIKLFSEKLSIHKNPKNINMVIFRENTEDIYLGLGQVENKNTKNEITLDYSKHTYNGVFRIIDAAFRYAILNKRKRVTLVDKSNAIKFGGCLWQRIFKDVAGKYPKIVSDHLFIDVVCMHMVQNPQRFDVIVTSNIFGDILSDLGAGLVGGLGLLASANINPGTFALFEPVHGSAPDIANQGIANPFAMFLSVAMMVQYFGYNEIAILIEQAIKHAINENQVTCDLGGDLTCSQASDKIISII